MSTRAAMDTYQDQARETEHYHLRYRPSNKALPDFPPLRGPSDRVRRHAPLPVYPRPQQPRRRGKQRHQLKERESIARVLAAGLHLIWRHLYLVGQWHGVDIIIVLEFVQGLPCWQILQRHARHWRRYWALSMLLLYGLLFCSANVEYHLRFTRAAMKPPAYDAFHPSCPPTFIAATCPEILRIPPRVYPRLLEPASSVSSFYKQMMKCWHPDKIHFHPNQAAADTFAKDVRVILALCRDRMSLGKLYPRSIWSRGRREHIEIDQSGLWNAGTLDLDLDSILNLGLNSSLDSHSNFVDSKFSFPQSTKPCICDMDTAVSNLLRSPFTPPWSTFYTTKKPFPRTMEQLVDYCACDIQTAWSPFQHIFNISIVSPRIIQYTLLPSWIHFIQGFDIPQDLQIALGWVVLKANVPWLRPLSLALSIFLPVPTIQSFHTLHLPPRGIHQFWLDRSLRGLPPDSMRKISVPSAWTDELRHYGCDGADEYNEVGTRRKNLSDHEKLACKKKGWCFRGEFGDWDY